MAQPVASPPTTRLRSTPVTSKRGTRELANAEGTNTDIRTKEEATIFLQSREYLVPDTQADLLTLAHVLFQLGVPTTRTPKIVTDGIRAVAFLIADAAAQQMAGEITTLVKSQLQDHLGEFNDSVETMRDAVEHVSGATMQLTDKIDEFRKDFQDVADQLTETTLELSQTTQDLTTKTSSPTPTPTIATTPESTTSPPYQSGPASYAAIASRQIDPAHADVIARSANAEKQILILANKTNPEAPPSDLTEKDLVTKANLALELMDDPGTNKPTAITFIAAKKLQNDNVLYQLNSPQAAKWLRNPKVQATFLQSYSSTAHIRNKLYHVIVEFAPTSFLADSPQAHTTLERNNPISPSSVVWSKFVKPPHLRTPNQKSAHIILGLANKKDANSLIQHGIFIEGRHSTVRKTVTSPRRCLKCQRYGHHVPDCKATCDTCALCAQNHRTNLCPNTANPRKCANCKGDNALNHGAGDKDCPAFEAEKRNLHKKNPEHKYKFFPTEDPTTWKLLSETHQGSTYTPPTTTITHQYPPETHNRRGDYYRPNQTTYNITDHYSPERQRTYVTKARNTARHPTPNANDNPRQSDAGWPTRPTQSTLDSHFRTPQPHNDAPPYTRNTTTSNVSPNNNETSYSNNNGTTPTLTNDTPRANTTTSIIRSVRWADDIPEDPISNLPPLYFPDRQPSPALEYV